MDTPRPLVTVVIPCPQGLPVGLDAWRAQDFPLEILLLANGAFDGGTLPRAEPMARRLEASRPLEWPSATLPPPGGWPVRQVRVAWQGHGATRQRAVEIVATPLLLFTVDDALPAGPSVARAMVRTLLQTNVDAVTARQVPWAMADAVTRSRLAAWTPRDGGAPPLDHVCALHRADLLRARPLAEVATAEDWEWSLGRGHVQPRVALAEDAAVVHSHPRRFRSLLARTRAEHAVRVRAGEPPRVPDLATLARALPSTVGADLAGSLAELLGQWAGARDGRNAAREPLGVERPA